MDETPGWVDPTPPPDGVRPDGLEPDGAPADEAGPRRPAEPAEPAEPVAPPAAPLPPAWQYFTSPTPAAEGTPPPAQSSWGWQPPPTPTPDHRRGQYGPPPGQYGGPPPGQPSGPPPYAPNPQFGPPPQYAPDPRFGIPPHYGPSGQYPPPPQYGQYPQYGGPQYGQWGGGYQQEYKPGIVPLRPLSVGEVLDGSFSTIRQYPRIVFGFAAVLSVIAQLIRLLVGLALNNVPGTFGSTSFSPNNNDDSTQNLHTVATSLGGTAATLVVDALCVAILAGVVTGVVGKAVIGQRADGREIIAAVRQRWFGLLVVSVLAEILPWTPFILIGIGVVLGAVSTGLGIFVGVVGGLAALVLGPLLWGRLAVAVPIFILERRGPGASIARSWRLVNGAFWRTWGLRALVQIIVSVAASILSVPLVLVLLPSALNGKTPSTTALVLLVILGAVVWMLTQPLIAASLTLIYIDRRMRAEGLDVQLTQAARAAATPASQAASVT
ncbi:MAG TPA: hypothetical protein VGL75_07585 [Acidothermaceae bacterium]